MTCWVQINLIFFSFAGLTSFKTVLLNQDVGLSSKTLNVFFPFPSQPFSAFVFFLFTGCFREEYDFRSLPEP